MDIAELHALVTVAEAGSFSRAAEILHLSQPAVSKRIAGLEAELDTRLLERIGRRVTLTDAGATLLPRARHVLQEIEDSRRAISRLSEHVGGRLSVGTSHHIGLHRLPEMLGRYIELYPNVELDIQFMDSEDACDAVLHGTLELGVVTLPHPSHATRHTSTRARSPAQLGMQEVWHDPLGVFVAPQHPLARLARPRVADLAHHAAVLPDDRTYTHRIVRAALAQHGIEPHLRLSTNYLETLRMLVSIGLGWSVLPLSMADTSVHILKLPELIIERRLGVVWHQRRERSVSAQAMLHLLGAK